MNNIKVKKLYSLIILLLPVLAQYSFFSGNLDFDVIAMALLFAVIFITPHRTARADIFFCLLFFYTFFITTVNILSGTAFAGTLSVVMRAGRYLLYIFITIVWGKDSVFDYEITMNIYRKIAYAALIYIVFQTVFYYIFHIVLPNKIGGSIAAAGENMGRLRAFYSEPADMSYSLIPFICCSLFGPAYRANDRRVTDAMSVSVAVALTTSGQGIICISIVWALWFVINISTGKLSGKYVGILISVCAAVIILYKYGILEFALGRVMDNSGHGAVSARASGYVTFSLLTPLQWIFGAGYGNYVTKNIYGLNVPYEFVNYSSLAEQIFTTGIVGTCFLFLYLFYGFMKGKTCQRIIICAVLFLMAGGCPLSGKYLPIYFSFIFCGCGKPDAAPQFQNSMMRRQG